MNDINIITMGVINITPNSFSDGGHFDSAPDLEAHFKSLSTDTHLIWDIGAESTAPFNNPISYNKERERLSLALPLLERFKPAMISLDSYRGQTANWFFSAARDLSLIHI